MAGRYASETTVSAESSRAEIERFSPAGAAMVFKLIESAQTRWRAVNAPHLVAPRAGRSHIPQEETPRTT